MFYKISKPAWSPLSGYFKNLKTIVREISNNSDYKNSDITELY